MKRTKSRNETERCRLATLIEGAGCVFFSSAKISTKNSYFNGVNTVKLDNHYIQVYIKWKCLRDLNTYIHTYIQCCID